MADRAYPDALPSDYRLHWYVLLRVLGQGGFGITYLARDTNLDQAVAIKEYLPIDMASRLPDATVRCRTEELRERYRWGLDRFIQEARTLARFDHPNIVRVHSVFEANDTAYMVMRFEEGQNLAALLDRRGTLPEPEVQRILLSILDGLALVHGAGFIHRDIKPDNIHIRTDGTPVLLDFGSARHAIGKARTMTILVAPGYAPLEQYYSDPEAQGPWTDIYGLAATCYRAIAGVTPIDAIARSKGILGSADDVLVPASVIGRGRYSERLLRAIDHGLAFSEKDRPQTIAEWRDEITGGSEAQAVVHSPAPRPGSTSAAAPGAIPVARGDATVRPRRTLPLAPIAWSVAGGVAAAVTIALLLRAPSPDAEAERRVTEARLQLEQERRRFEEERKREEELRAQRAESERVARAADPGPSSPKPVPEPRPVPKSAEEASRRPAAPPPKPVAEAVKAAPAARPRQETKATETTATAAAQPTSAVSNDAARSPVPATAEPETPRPAYVAPAPVATVQPNSVGNGPPSQQQRQQTALERLAEAEQLDARGDHAASAALFRTLADGGSARAQVRLAGMLLNGRGVARDEAAAVNWYRKAADLGDGEAQFFLGNMYAEGRGGAKSINQAYVWYSLAARSGHPGAESARKRVLAQLQPAEVAQLDKVIAARAR